MYIDQRIQILRKGGCGFLGLLQIAFIVLKLCKVISWNWVFVLMPLIALIVAVIGAVLE